MPNRELLAKIRKIEIQTRRLVQQRFAGGYHSVFKGRGIEFAQIREYVPGDDVRLIDWNATARLGEPFVKLFVEERELTVLLLVDVSASMYFGSRERLKRQLATEFCATIAFSAISNNDRVGLVLFSDQVELIVPPKKGRGHIFRLLRELLTFRPTGRGTDLATALETANRLLRRAATLFVVSDFTAPDFARPLAVAGKRHDTIAVTLADPLETAPAGWPTEGVYALEDPESGDRRLIDFGHAPTRAALTAAWQRIAGERDRQLRRADVDRIRLATDESFVEPLVAFFRQRARRLGQGL
ncbi:MAG: DUF58 domain-containing protein [Fimbriimonadaceae bacterium]|nr:DUF58 domain-containing protein [Fimbriimonadaceae bacterium]